MTSPPSQPPLQWQVSTAMAMGVAGIICRGFLYGANKTETVGLEHFLEVLDRRKDVDKRDRGLLTVANHVGVLDDPLMWGVLPIKYGFNPENHRWGLGSHDICFPNKPLSMFFSLGQVLPCHRARHSEFGGLFQPTITQAIRLLSSQPFNSPPSTSPKHGRASSPSSEVSDPFTTNQFHYPSTFSTTGTDSFASPSYYPSRRHSWVHIFPEGSIRQEPQTGMRYFKWGVSRLILESEPLPAIVPIYIDGTHHIMDEERKWPRFVPRIGKKVIVAFGQEVDGEKLFGDLRRRWQRLVVLQKEALERKGMGREEVEKQLEMGELTEGLKFGKEAVEIRKEVTRRVRMEVLNVRRNLGYPEEDPKDGWVETWKEHAKKDQNQFKLDDGSRSEKNVANK